MAEVGTEETGRVDRDGSWELSLDAEDGILVFANGSVKDCRHLAARRPLTLDDRGLFLLGFFTAEPPLLFTLKLMVEKVESLLVCLRRANDREHALTRLVMWFLGDGNLGAGQSTNLGYLGSVPTDYATNHVRGDGDGLSPKISLLCLLG